MSDFEVEFHNYNFTFTLNCLNFFALIKRMEENKENLKAVENR